MDDAKYIEVLSFHKRQPIFYEGEIGKCMYVIEEGRVGIVANYGLPTEKQLTELKAGDFFGEMGMVRGLRRSASAVALESFTRVAVITWDTLGNYFKSAPGKIVGIMQQMGRRIEELSTDYVGACGAVTALMEERDMLEKQRSALLKENKALSKELDKERARDSGLPVWQQIKDEEKNWQNPPFKKYIEEYQRYMNMR